MMVLDKARDEELDLSLTGRRYLQIDRKCPAQTGQKVVEL